ncbi:hypothetical protein BC828DRAFT_397325 [Blastocladiella britannica]|nr:hypothetical protein BC828DRAFT_397325 [Blastocladiella britannica]
MHPGRAETLALAAHLSPMCHMVCTPGCSLIRAHLRLMEKMATAAATANRFDMMVALVDGGLVQVLDNAVGYLRLVGGGNYDACEPLLRIIQVYLASGVDTKPCWGDREKVMEWISSIENLDLILEKVTTCCQTSKKVGDLASAVHGLFHKEEDEEGWEDVE